MTGYLIRRLTQCVIVLWLVTLLVFIVMRLLPGDPLMLYIAENQLDRMPAEQLAVMRHEFGLDKSLPMQYVDWIGSIFHGDLGKSIFFREDVGHLIAQRMPITMHLGLISFLISSILGILAGVVCAVRRGSWIDNTVTVLANIGITTPSFWAGILLIYFFALKLGLLPTSGYTSPFEDFFMSTRQVLMPVCCLALMPLAALTRQTRSSMLEVVQQDYIRTAWSKGLKEQVIVFRHMVKNALIPVVTIMGMQVRNIFGGAVLIETVFNIPGIGRMLVQAVFGQDYQVVQAGVLIAAVVVTLSNLTVEISYGWFDPRIQYS